MKQISFFIPLLGTLLLSGCAGTSTEFECNATTSDTCMTMEQANEKAKKLEQSSEAKPVAASLPRLAEGNFRTMPVQTVTATTPSGSRPAVTAHPEQKLLAPRPLFTATRAYYMKAAATQFPLPEGMNLPLTLRHYPGRSEKRLAVYFVERRHPCLPEAGDLHVAVHCYSWSAGNGRKP